MSGWIKSSFSGEGNCLEVQWGTTIRIRDDKNPDVVVKTTPNDWQAFIDGVKAGEFDLHKLM